MKLVSFLYADWMSEEEIQISEFSDRIWVPNRIFQRWMNEEDVGSVVIVELDGGSKQVSACMYGAHSRHENVIYAPTWICHELKVSGEPPVNEDDEDDDEDDAIEMIRMRPDQCTFLKIQPFTSAHIHTSELLQESAEDVLSRGLESYTCIKKGQVLTIRLQTGDLLGFEVLEASPDYSELLCIRAGEIELDLLPPLDLPEPEPVQPEPEPVQPEPEPVFVPEPVPEPAPIPETREERRRKMAAAALARIACQN
jgi:hypothetical protein